MAPPSYTTLNVNYGTSSVVVVNVTAVLATTGGSMSWADLARLIAKEGYWSGNTFIPAGQITSIVAS